MKVKVNISIDVHIIYNVYILKEKYIDKIRWGRLMQEKVKCGERKKIIF